MGTRTKITHIPFESMRPKRLPTGSWSEMLISDHTVSGNKCSLGYSLFKPDTVSVPLRHDAEELVFVAKGSGELRSHGICLPFRQLDSLYIPPDVWHWVANTGTDDVVMIFAFATPGRPRTDSEPLGGGRS
jgi:quercetin dioxygenase-like cupin family protein